MAYFDDPFDPYSSEGMFGSAIESEEQRRERERREAEARKIAGNTEVATEKTTRYQDGSSTVSTTKELPPPPARPNLLSRVGQDITQAGSNFVNNLQNAPGNLVNNVKAIPGRVTAVNPANYNNDIQKQESGNNPNIGYHYPADAQGRRKSTAYGAFGITAPAYQDIQKANPQFAGRPIESLTVEEQGQANQTYRQVLSRQLTALGIEPTEANIRGAQFVGAAGLAANQRTGQVSDAAAAANGGPAKVKQILQNRMDGTPAPASAAAEQQRLAQAQATATGGRGPGGSSVNIGATPSWAQLGTKDADFAKNIGISPSVPGAQTPPAAAVPVVPAAMPPSGSNAAYSLATGVPGQGLGTAQQRMASQAPAPPDATSQAISRYQAIQTDPNQLMKFAFDPATPAYLQTRAKDQIVEQYDQQKKLKQAEADLKGATPADIGRVINRRSTAGQEPTAGDWLQYLVLRTMPAFEDLANEKGEKLGIGKKWTQSTYTDADNNTIAVELQTTASGKILGGNRLGSDTPLTQEELNLAGGGLGGGKFKPEVSSGAYVKTDANGKVLTGVRVTQVVNGRTVTKIESGGKTYDINDGWTQESISTAGAKMELKYAIGLKEKFGSDMIGGYTQFVKDYPTASQEQKQQMATYLGLGPAELKAVGLSPAAPAAGQTPPPAAGQTPPPAAAGTGLVPPAAGQTPKVAAGSPDAGAARATAAGVYVPPKPVRTPEKGDAAFKAEMDTWIAAVKEANRVAGGIAEEAGKSPIRVAEADIIQFNKTTAPEVNTRGESGRQVASIRRTQLASITSNPSILGIFNGTGDSYDRARSVITGLITGAYAAENSGDLDRDVRALGLTEAERAALEDFANSNRAINAQTLRANSGAGPVSNAEQTANQNANLQNLAKTTPLGALQGLHASQFTGDLAGAKADFLARNPQLNTDTKFNSAWAKESTQITKAYEGIIEARIEFLKQFRPPAGASAAQLNAFKDKTFKAFEMYPAPQYNIDTGKWNYQTANAQRAAAKKLLGR